MAAKLKFIFGDFLRSLRHLWLEIVGALFLTLAVMFGLSTYQEYQRYTQMAGRGIFALLSVGTLCVLTFVFGVRSFWKARKLR